MQNASREVALYFLPKTRTPLVRVPAAQMLTIHSPQCNDHGGGGKWGMTKGREIITRVVKVNNKKLLLIK